MVAITVTDRAAREMRDRIRGAEVAKLTGPAGRGGHLRALETAPIATIHGFCGTLLRQFAVPAGLDPGFEVLDDVLSANIRTEALKECLHGLLVAEAPPATAALRELVVLFGWGAVVEAIDGLLLAADRPAWEAWLSRSPDDIAAEWLGPARAGLLPEWVASVRRHRRSPGASGCSPASGVRRPRDGRQNVARLLAETPRLHEAADLAAAAEELAELAKVGKERAKAWPDEATYAAVKDAFAKLRARPCRST